MVKEIGADAERRPMVEVWLTRKNIAITGRVASDAGSVTQVELDSVSMRGAQREMTGYLKGLGFEPVGRWESEHLGGHAPADVEETFRTFRKEAHEEEPER